MSLIKPIIFQNVRLSFPNLVEAKVNPKFPNGPKSFNANFIMPPNHPGFAALLASVNEIAVEKWKAQAGPVMNLINVDRAKRHYGKGDEMVNGKTGVVYDGYAGMVYVTGQSKEDAPPQIMVNRKVVTGAEREAAARKLYAGCYVNVALSPWPQDNGGNRGLRCNLIGLEFCGDGEPLGGAVPDATVLFAELAMPSGFTEQAAPAAAPSTLPSFFG